MHVWEIEFHSNSKTIEHVRTKAEELGFKIGYTMHWFQHSPELRDKVYMFVRHEVETQISLLLLSTEITSYKQLAQN